MKKRVFILLGVLIIGGAVAGVCWKKGLFGQQESSAGSAFVSKVSDITGDVSGVTNRYAGVVEPQETVEITLESNRSVKEVQVKVGDQVEEGQLLFEYDLSSIEEDLEEAQLDYDRLVNEAASLNEQISTLEKEKAKATKDNQLSYTIEIETNRMNLKKNEYNQKTKQAEITKLQNATGNTEVRSTIDGVIQKIDTSQMSTDDGDGEVSESDISYGDTSDGSSSAFITILSTGAYRIKGTVNELNAASIVEGEPVIIRSRVDADQTWSGTMGSIDRDNATTNSSDSLYYSDSDSDSQTSSSTYPFYVSLDSSDGLMLGQHVYIEPDEGQDTEKSGLWLSEVYIEDIDTGEPYVWARDDENKLEKRSVVLGQYDEDLCEYEIADGLSKEDYIAYPSALLEVGMSTTTDSSEAVDMQSLDSDGSSDSSDSSEGFTEESIPVDDAAMEAEIGSGAVSDDSWSSEFSTEDTGEVLDSSEWSDVSVYSDSSDSSSSEDISDTISDDGTPVE